MERKPTTYSGVTYTGLTVFRRDLKEYIRIVEAGERVVLLRNDQPVAVVLSVTEADEHGLMPALPTPEARALNTLLSKAESDTSDLPDNVRAALATLREAVANGSSK